VQTTICALLRASGMSTSYLRACLCPDVQASGSVVLTFIIFPSPVFSLRIVLASPVPERRFCHCTPFHYSTSILSLAPLVVEVTTP
jgi:hypothetical protein